MTMNLLIEPAIPTLIEQVRDSAIAVLAQHDLYSLLRYQSFGGGQRERETALMWLDRRLGNARLENVLHLPRHSQRACRSNDAASITRPIGVCRKSYLPRHESNCRAARAHPPLP